jgi:hypothetical protein
MKSCKKCGSYAINPGKHGRDDMDLDLCDVCYWRKRAEVPALPERWRYCGINQRGTTGNWFGHAEIYGHGKAAIVDAQCDTLPALLQKLARKAREAGV